MGYGNPNEKISGAFRAINAPALGARAADESEGREERGSGGSVMGLRLSSGTYMEHMVTPVKKFLPRKPA
jgi:hypothetical protein